MSLSPTELKRLHREWRRRTDLRLALVLDGVQKPYNVGGLLRSAAAYKAEAIWAVPPTPSPSERSVAKISLGSERLLDWHDVASGVEAVAAARAAGFVTIAIELTTTARPLFDIDCTAAGTPPAVCLVLGHEERGVHKSTLAEVDHVGFLPQLGKIGSLNVAQAGTVALYEVARQVWT